MLCISVANDLKRRVHEHKKRLIKGVTKRYNVDKLVYHKMESEIMEAIFRKETT